MGKAVFLHLGSILVVIISWPDFSNAGCWIVVWQFWCTPWSEEGNFSHMDAILWHEACLWQFGVCGCYLLSVQVNGWATWAAAWSPSPQSQKFLPVHLTTALESHLGLKVAKAILILKRTVVCQNILPAKRTCIVTGGEVVDGMSVRFT